MFMSVNEVSGKVLSGGGEVNLKIPIYDIR